MKWFVFALVMIVSRADATNIAIGSTYGSPSTTVAGLPTCNASMNNRIYTVTNALAPAIAGIVAGGGAVIVMVRCNGTNWIVG